MSPRSVFRCLASLSLALASATPVFARGRASGSEAKDVCFWPAGGPKEVRDSVQSLVSEGNSLLNQSLFVPAAEKYREALKQCNHPALHYNLALALMNLDQPVEMHAHFMAATSHGPEPIEKERFIQARNYATLLERQLVELHVRCEVPDALVTLDGQPLFTPPGDFRGMVRPGFHTIAASKEGLYPNEVRRVLTGGGALHLRLDLKAEEELTEYRRHWAPWKPWAVVGGGAVLGLTGGALQYFGVKKVEDFDAGLAAGQRDARDLGPGRDQGVHMQQAAYGAYAAAGAALVTGVVMVLLNKERLFIRPYQVEVATEGAATAGTGPAAESGDSP